MTERKPSRRDFLKGMGSAVGGSWLAMHWPAMAAAGEAAGQARDTGAEFQTLSGPDAADLEAIAAQIIPSDDSPGAREAGVIYFIDRALGSFMADKADTIQAGLEAMNAEVLEQAGVPRFADLDPDRQIEVLKARETTPFFWEVRLLTLAGMFAMPSYGGNRNHLGWELLGFEHRHVWQPPFGYYDAQATDEREDHG